MLIKFLPSGARALEETIFNDQNDEFCVKVAATIDEAKKLLETGFDYVTDMEGQKLFRRRR
jgi:hypothetical protein